MDCDVHKYPERVKLWKTYNKKVADDEVDTLCVAHLGKVVSYTFEYTLESFLLVFGKFTCSVDVLFDLGKLSMLVNEAIVLKNKVRFILGINLLELILMFRLG